MRQPFCEFVETRQRNAIQAEVEKLVTTNENLAIRSAIIVLVWSDPDGSDLPPTDEAADRKR